MKRSENNCEIHRSKVFFASFQFKLMPFAAYTPADSTPLKNKGGRRER